jgi:hypothetical protein
MGEHEHSHTLVMNSDEVMDKFCWSFSNALLEKLVALDEQGRTWFYGKENDKVGMGKFELTPSASIAVKALALQIDYTPKGCNYGVAAIEPTEFYAFLAIAREFLSAFVKE